MGKKKKKTWSTYLQGRKRAKVDLKNNEVNAILTRGLQNGDWKDRTEWRQKMAYKNGHTKMLDI